MPGVTTVSGSSVPSSTTCWVCTTVVLAAIAITGLKLRDRKSTRLNSSHLVISYAVFCLKKKKNMWFREGRIAHHGTALRGRRGDAAWSRPRPVYLYVVWQRFVGLVCAGVSVLLAPSSHA